VEAYRDRFPRRWKPSTFQLLPEAFTVHNRMLNSTLKTVRHEITKAHADLRLPDWFAFRYIFTIAVHRKDRP